MNTQEIISDVENKLRSLGGLSEIYFVACGGSLAALYPSKYLLELESRTNLRIGFSTSNEFVHATPKKLGKNSLVITCSHQGDTPETVEATELARSRGSTCIVLTYNADSPITKFGDYVIAYEWGPGSRVENQKISIGLKIAFELLKVYEAYAHYQKAMDSFNKVHDLVQRARQQVYPKAKAFSEECKEQEVIYTLGSGPNFAVSYIEAICILIEMQWIHSGSFHSGEFFHGPLEITDDQTPMILMMSVGRTRPLDQRVLDFLTKYGRKIHVIDAEELGFGSLPDSVSEFICPVFLLNVVDVYNQELAVQRNHPLTQRRYMWKVSY